MSNIWLRVNSVSVSIIAFDPNPESFTYMKLNIASSALSLLPVGISHFITMSSLADGPDKKLPPYFTMGNLNKGCKHIFREVKLGGGGGERR